MQRSLIFFQESIKSEKTLDLELFSPVLKERCMIQIKSVSNPTEFEKYCKEFKNYKG